MHMWMWLGILGQVPFAVCLALHPIETPGTNFSCPISSKKGYWIPDIKNYLYLYAIPVDRCWSCFCRLIPRAFGENHGFPYTFSHQLVDIPCSFFACKRSDPGPACRRSWPCHVRWCGCGCPSQAEGFPWLREGQTFETFASGAQA